MLGLIATITVDPEKQQAFEALMTNLIKTVREKEPAVLTYTLCRTRSDTPVYRMIEVYESQAALDSHMATEWFQSAAAKFPEFFAVKPELDMLDVVA